MISRLTLARRWWMLWIGAALIAWMAWRLLHATEIIDTVPIARGDIEDSVTALGTVQPRSYVDVGAQASGAILHIHVQPGDSVKKDQLLVEIDPALQKATVDAHRAALQSLGAQLQEARAQSVLAQQQLERQRKMDADGAARAEDLQTAQAGWESANSRVAGLRAQIQGARSTLQGDEAQLGYTRIFAPMAGTVVTLDAREGQTINATYQTPTILRIADLSTMKIWTEVSEADITQIKTGMPVYFTTLGNRQRRWSAQVSQILPAPIHAESRAADPNSGSNAAVPSNAAQVVLYTVLFEVANPDSELMPQMSAQVFFLSAAAKDVTIAPLAALEPLPGAQDTYRATVLVNGKLQTRRVQTGIRDRLHIEIRSGLAVGDRLVTGVRHERIAEGKFQW